MFRELEMLFPDATD